MILLLSFAARAATLSVDPSDPTAYLLIQDAIDDAADGDTIALAGATFSECLNTSGKNLSLEGVSGVTTLDANVRCTDAMIVIEGGETVTFKGMVMQDALKRFFWVDSATLVLEDVQVSGNTPSSTEGAGIYANHADITVVDSSFSDLVGTNGAAIETLDSDIVVSGSEFYDCLTVFSGGALYLYLNGSNEVDISDSTFTDNIADAWDGGAVYISEIYDDDALYTTRVSVRDSSFVNNDASDSGGGLIVYVADEVELSGSTFQGNRASGDSGGGVEFSDVDALSVHHNSFCGNTAGSGGGAMGYGNGVERWERNLFWENSASSYGAGGFHLVSAESASVINNTLVGNVAGKASGAGGVKISKSVVDFRNNIVAWNSVGNGLTVSDEATGLAFAPTYNSWYGNSPAHLGDYASFDTAADGNIEADPLFVSFAIDGDCGDDLHLVDGSPLIDAGDPADLDEDGSAVDIGAYGGEIAEPVDTGSGDTATVDTSDTSDTSDTGGQETGGQETGPNDDSAQESAAPTDSEPPDSAAPADTVEDPKIDASGCCGTGARGGRGAVLLVALLALARRRPAAMSR